MTIDKVFSPEQCEYLLFETRLRDLLHVRLVITIDNQTSVFGEVEDVVTSQADVVFQPVQKVLSGFALQSEGEHKVHYWARLRVLAVDVHHDIVQGPKQAVLRIWELTNQSLEGLVGLSLLSEEFSFYKYDLSLLIFNCLDLTFGDEFTEKEVQTMQRGQIQNLRDLAPSKPEFRKAEPDVTCTFLVKRLKELDEVFEFTNGGCFASAVFASVDANVI